MLIPIEVAGFSLFIVTLWIILYRVNAGRNAIKSSRRPVPYDHIEKHISDVATQHSGSVEKKAPRWPMHRLHHNIKVIFSTYEKLNHSIENHREVPPSAEWILDNFYLIEEQAKVLRRELSKKSYFRLPILKTGELSGHTRILALVTELSGLSDGKMDESRLIQFLNTYQNHNKIYDREIWALPLVLKLVLLEQIGEICEKILDTQAQWEKADSLVEALVSREELSEKKIKRLLKNVIKEGKHYHSFVEHLTYRLHTSNFKHPELRLHINEFLDKHAKNTVAVSHRELNAQSVLTVSVGNHITALKHFAMLDWSDLFEAVSSVGHILSKDPDGTYLLMDFATRNAYKERIENLSAIYGVEEDIIAAKAVELAKTAYDTKDTCNAAKGHVGYFLIGKGINDLRKALKAKTIWKSVLVRLAQENPTTLYVGSIIAISIFLILIAAQNAFSQSLTYSWIWGIIAIIIVAIPSSEIAVSIVNWVAAKALKPAVFPALELKEGIPEAMSTMIVITAILPNHEVLSELIQGLETHYLSNRNKNLYFALVGAFKDSTAEVPDDLVLIEAAMRGIKELNEKYMSDDAEIFYFFHRSSQYNPENKKWIGWERKRGALMEFNDLILGSEQTSFRYQSNQKSSFPKIKYVITLDSDSILPMGMAKTMIATMTHPLNRPVIDEKRGVVVEGYGLMQPRVDFDSENSGKTSFSRTYTGQVGIDPYASAISDVYQDLFGEGIYTGKGIYDLEVFQRVLKHAIPDNKILSHDLYEGSYVRAALVTSLKVVESYPTKYNSFSARLYRWTRGDWQLLPFLFKTIPSGKKRIDNPLSFLSKWKIFDNLRRSLVAPALMVLIAFGVSLLSGNMLLWMGYVLGVLLFPLVSSTLSFLLSRSVFRERIKSYIPIVDGLKALLLQSILTIVFLPYQACLMIKAMVVTLWRVIVSKMNMLEWTTSFDSDASQNDSLWGYFKNMQAAIWVAGAMVVLTMVFHPSSIILSSLLFILWATSPYLAYQISREHKEKFSQKPEKETLELRMIARRTWQYFESFAGQEHNYLAPDNYQEDPFKGIAERTSPTNIGLGALAILTARDMGYIGINQMADALNCTISSIEKLQKWNGHLYNWYDVKTLKPLKPYFVSTVDSGNLVCYLTVLEQGLLEYLKLPFADMKNVSGLLDTLMCAEEDGFKAIKGMDTVNRARGQALSFDEWRGLLDELSREDALAEFNDLTWRGRFERMIEQFKFDLSLLTPLAEIRETFPPSLRGRLSDEQTTLLSKIEVRGYDIPNLNNIPFILQRALDLLGALAGACEESEHTWLNTTIDACTKSLQKAEALISRINQLIVRIRDMSKATRFIYLYDAKKQLFSIGYSIKGKKLSRSYYDLLASEARQTSYIAIARGEIPVSHWFRMGRTLTVMDGYKGLLSWTGTMFEYLMPLLIMKSYKNTLLDETYAFAVRNQKKYGMQKGMPWGVSESGYYASENNLNYKYKAIGVPWLGLRRSLDNDAVAAPYATFLAIMVDPEGALKNLNRLKAVGMEGEYGFYEAVDYTPKRTSNQKIAIVKSYMAHHQGMSLLAVDNFLNNNVMQKRFHANPEVKSARLLLQEKIPANIIFLKENKEKVLPLESLKAEEREYVQKFDEPDMAIPNSHILTNGDYSVFLTDRGTGFSKNKEIAITRWREDITLDEYGMFCFLRHLETNKTWTNTYTPERKLPKRYKVIFTPDMAKFFRVDDGIETTTEVIVTANDNVEIRRLTLKNLEDRTATIDVTSYFEVVLATLPQDIAHPAFSNLFIKTEYLTEEQCIIARRRTKSEDEKQWMAANSVVVEKGLSGAIQFETDRMKFIGRGKSITDAAGAQRHPMTNTAGAVLDPVMSLRARIAIPPRDTVTVSFITAVSNEREPLLKLVEKFATPELIEAAFFLAKVRSRAEAKHFNITANEIAIYEEMISHILFISPLKRRQQEMAEKNILGQSALWRYGISGDYPIVLTIINQSQDFSFCSAVMKAREYWRRKGLSVDLVVLANLETSYNQLFHDSVSNAENGQMQDETKAFVLNINELPEDDIYLLYATARIVLEDSGGTLKEQIALKKDLHSPKAKRLTEKKENYQVNRAPDLETKTNFNGMGGFSQDGTEYIIRLKDNENTPAPWTNVIANSAFGFLVSESGSSYTWNGNCRENKLTPWNNDMVSDSPGEVLYISDNDTGEAWTVSALPIRETEPYEIRHGFGYSIFSHTSHGIRQNLTQFVPLDDTAKISLLEVKNESDRTRSLCLTYYIRPVLGVSDQVTAMHIKTRQNDSGMLLMENPYNEEFSGQVGFLDVSIKEREMTGDRKAFFGEGGMKAPDALKHERLIKTFGTGLDPCAVIQVNLTLTPNENREIVFLLGESENEDKAIATAKEYVDIDRAKQALAEVKAFWKNRLSAIQVKTPSESFNLLMNGWLEYQVISCRLWARTSFYQAGGAYGFRDQLQDCLALLHTWPEISRKQILLHASRQFEEGDVQHWWHAPWGRGTRTRYTDDLLWLPYVTAQYIKATGDAAILDTQIPFLQEEVLKDEEAERYSRPEISEETATLFEHCRRAMTKSLRFGQHGLPLMGSGDWNDGMNNVGSGGLGESVWLGWFLCAILKDFVPICISRGESVIAEEYNQFLGDISDALDKNAWDGEWYKRAYFDDGKPLGSKVNTECMIDAIAQSWSVISGASNDEKARMAMDSFEKYLVDKENGIIKLLTPPFDGKQSDPGYIKGYLPGVRENGGQYTHAAAWAIIAWAKLGEREKAWTCFDMINPLSHTQSEKEREVYKLEPYVMAADVYAKDPNTGRGGWSWYTGSASWVYKAGLEEILGFQKIGEQLIIKPCIPKRWKKYSIHYQYLSTTYNIEVHQLPVHDKSETEILVDGKAIFKEAIQLVDDGAVHHVVINLNSARTS